MATARRNTSPKLPPRLRPIGKIRSSFHTKFAAPHQPDHGQSTENTIELIPRRNFEQAVQDLAGFSHIWLVWWFHENRTWKPLVRPPRGDAMKRGVFATRSPHRPNPIGITVVELRSVSGRCLTIGPCDLLDGTPILDIKPYIPAIDAFPEASNGWLAAIAAAPRFSVSLSPRAAEQARWLRENYAIDFISRAIQLLEIDPTPHRTRRISAVPGGFRMGCGGWRLHFTRRDTAITIERCTPGYPQSYLDDPKLTKVPDRDAQRAFRRRWNS